VKEHSAQGSGNPEAVAPIRCNPRPIFKEPDDNHARYERQDRFCVEGTGRSFWTRRKVIVQSNQEETSPESDGQKALERSGSEITPPEAPRDRSQT
jgi:hypothetical protein